MARKAYVYNVNLPELLRLGLVSVYTNTEGDESYRARGRLDDIIYGLGHQSDQLYEYDVRPGTLHKLAMMDGMTAERIARRESCTLRQAQMYMRKLRTIQGYCERYIAAGW